MAGASGASGAAGTSAGTSAGTGGELSDGGSLDASDDAGPTEAELRAYASGLHELFIDVPCASSTPLPLTNGATCDHPPNTQHIEREVTLGGDASITYTVTLSVRGIWEPTHIAGGTAPSSEEPFKIGGTIAAGNAIEYQQYSIEVSAPAQTYWLNDHQYVAHDIHKLDYEAAIEAQGGATVTVIMNDGNERQIANYTRDYFEGLPPYDTAPSTGQMLRLDVVSVSIPE
jgi:hypothetical protein